MKKYLKEILVLSCIAVAWGHGYFTGNSKRISFTKEAVKVAYYMGGEDVILAAIND